jgi:hypothetical protein
MGTISKKVKKRIRHSPARKNPGGFSMDVNTQKISDIVQQYVNDFKSKSKLIMPYFMVHTQKAIMMNKAMSMGQFFLRVLQAKIL